MVLVFNSNGDTPIGAEIQRKYYIFHLRWKEGIFSDEETSLEERLSEMSLTPEDVKQKLRNEDLLDNLWMSQMAMSMFCIACGVGLFFSDDRNVTFMAIITQGIALFWFLANPFMWDLDK